MSNNSSGLAVNSKNVKIEDWKLYTKNKYNGVAFDIPIDKISEIDFVTRDYYYLRIMTEEITTSNITEFNFDDLSIITQSGSRYYLGQPINIKYLEFLKQFFKN